MEVRLKRLPLANTVALLATLTLIVWRLAVLVQRQALAALSSDVRNVAQNAPGAA